MNDAEQVRGLAERLEKIGLHFRNGGDFSSAEACSAAARLLQQAERVKQSEFTWEDVRLLKEMYERQVERDDHWPELLDLAARIAALLPDAPHPTNSEGES